MRKLVSAENTQYFVFVFNLADLTMVESISIYIEQIYKRLVILAKKKSSTDDPPAIQEP